MCPSSRPWASATYRSRRPGVAGAAEGSGELQPDLGLLIAGERVDDAVHRRGGAAGVQGGQDEVSRLRSGQRRGDGGEVPHLSE